MKSMLRKSTKELTEAKAQVHLIHVLYMHRGMVHVAVLMIIALFHDSVPKE